MNDQTGTYRDIRITVVQVLRGYYDHVWVASCRMPGMPRIASSSDRNRDDALARLREQIDRYYTRQADVKSP